MTEFFLIERHLLSNQVDVFKLDSDNEEDAWEEIEDYYEEAHTQDMVLSEEKLRELSGKIMGE